MFRACSVRCEELKKLESTYLNFQTQLSSMEQVKNKQEQLRLNNIMRWALNSFLMISLIIAIPFFLRLILDQDQFDSIKRC